MVTDQQVRRLRRLDLQGLPKERAADKAGLDAKTARKYRRLGKLPSEVRRMDRDYRTRPDPFAAVWPQLEELLRLNPGLEAKTLFDDLQRRFPGRFADGQLRTFQRHVKRWRALHGSAKEVFFSQVHHPGRLCASDFTHCTDLRVTLNGVPFDHMIYHFVLTYSNWEAGTICFAESFESLSEGLQNALAALGGVPQLHRTDRLTAAIPPGTEGSAFFTARYQGLLRHYGLQGQAIQAGQAHENGDAEQSHRQFKRALEQALLLRGSRDFGSRPAYAEFLSRLFGQRNAGRQQRLAEEMPLLRPLPARRLEACRRLWVRVDRGSTIHVALQHLLGGEPADRREGRGARVRRATGGVVRATGGGDAAAPAWPGQASHPLSARDRLAGTQARGVRGLLLSPGFVSQQSLSSGLRCADGAAAGACGQGVSGDLVPGGTAERSGCRGGTGASAGRAWPAQCGSGGGGTGTE